jgi:hypothetical protein
LRFMMHPLDSLNFFRPFVSQDQRRALMSAVTDSQRRRA